MKELPKAIEAEVEVLGAILNENKLIYKCIEKLKKDDFYLDKHKALFGYMNSLFAEGKPINVITLIDLIGKENLLKVGGVSYISQIQEAGMNSEIDVYINILKDKSMRRKSIKNIKTAEQNLYDENKSLNETLGKLQNQFLKDDRVSSKMISENQLFNNVLDGIERRYRDGGDIPGMQTGFTAFDRATNGFKKGELVVLGGRPSMGKTLIALNMADRLAKNDYKVGVIEMEMTEESLGLRRLAYNANIEVQKLQTGKLTDDEFIKIGYTTNKLVKKNNIITDCSDYQNILTIRVKAKAMKQSTGLDVLFIDHLGLMDIQVKENRTYAIGEITRHLKLLAKELEITVVLLCQLSRGVEQRCDKRPILSDLRESGNIEQDADLVIFAYRDAYYNPQTEDSDIMEWIIAKQRNGKTGTLKFYYLDKFQKIENLDWRK